MPSLHPNALPGVLGPFPPLSGEARAESLERTLALAPKSDELWVFAYGSLIWKPEFDSHRIHRASLPGYHRSFCMWTTQARGRPDNPGLGLALAPGGSCEGLVLAVGREARRERLLALWEREMYTGIYRPEWVALELEDDRVMAIAFVIEHDHPQYAGGLPTDVQAQLIARAEGEKGSCYEYLRNTVKALRAHNIRDARLDEMLARTERVRAECN